MLPFKLALRYLMGRKLRSFLTTLAVVFGVSLIFGLNGLIPAFTEVFRKNMLATANQVDLEVTGATRGVFSADAVETVANSEGVAAATGSLTRSVNLPPASAPVLQTGEPLPVISLVGLDPVSAPQVRPLKVSEGRSLQPGDRSVALITTQLAERAALQVGDTLRLPSATGEQAFTIVGLVSGRVSMGAEEIFVPLADAQSLLNLPGQINAIEALFTAAADADAVRAAVMEQLGSGFKLGANEAGAEMASAIQMGQIAMNIFGVFALAMGGFIIYNTFRTIVAERRRDIGMLRAIGASRGLVRRTILAESLMQGIVGTALGIVGGYLLVMLMLNVTRDVIEMKLRFPVGSPTFTPGVFAAAILLGLGVTLAGGWFPAVAATRITPLEALRPPRPTVGDWGHRLHTLLGAALIVVSLLELASGQIQFSSVGVVLFLVGLVLAAPALVIPIARGLSSLFGLFFAREGRVAQGNITRQPERSAITASTIMISLTIVIAMGGMVSTIYGGILGYIDDSMGSDFLLMPQSLMLGGGNVGAGPELAQEIRAVEGIDAVTSLRLGTTQVKDMALQVIGIDPLAYEAVGGLIFSEGEAETIYPALQSGRAIVVNGVFASQAGVKVGDSLTLKTAEGPRDYQVVGIGLEFLNAKLASSYISQENLARDFHETADLLILANMQDGANAGKVWLDLQALAQTYPAFTLYDARGWKDTMTEASQGSMSLMYLLMFTLIVPSLIALVNTLAISVIERTREIGMLRAVGATRGQIRRMITAESLLLAGIGTVFGALSGVWMSYVLSGAVRVVGFNLPYTIPTTAVALSVGLGMLLGVLAAVLPARQAARLEVISALQYE